MMEEYAKLVGDSAYSTADTEDATMMAEYAATKNITRDYTSTLWSTADEPKCCA